MGRGTLTRTLRHRVGRVVPMGATSGGTQKRTLLQPVGRLGAMKASRRADAAGSGRATGAVRGEERSATVVGARGDDGVGDGS
jgi:hypothetical protein